MAESSDRLKTGVGGPGWRVPDPYPGPPVRMPRWRKSRPSRATLTARIVLGAVYVIALTTGVLLHHLSWSSVVWIVLSLAWIVAAVVQLVRTPKTPQSS